VDFCGFEMAIVGCWADMASDDMGAASGWLRCAEKSFCSVFSTCD
jgi:hypothetical protein